MNKIIIYHQGGVIHNVEGIPAGIELEFRDSDTEGVEEESKLINGEHYYVIRFGAEEVQP